MCTRMYPCGVCLTCGAKKCNGDGKALVDMCCLNLFTLSYIVSGQSTKIVVRVIDLVCFSVKGQSEKKIVIFVLFIEFQLQLLCYGFFALSLTAFGL